MPRYAIGLDVGSTTVKAVMVEPATGGVLWATYRRHETRQAERACDVLEEELARFGGDFADYRLYLVFGWLRRTAARHGIRDRQLRGCGQSYIFRNDYPAPANVPENVPATGRNQAKTSSREPMT